MTALVGSIQIRRDSAADWTAANPVLLEGQQGYETDTRQIKIGDGVTAWNSIAYWKEPISGTWAVIKALKDASSLIAGQLYRITDFATVQTSPIANTGATEELTLLALSTNVFHAQVFSEDFPQDIIRYEITDSSTAGGTKGRIYYRKDTLLNIETYYDWRNVKFRRWETSVGSGIYTAVSDPGSGAASVDRFTFNGYSAISDITIGKKTSGDQLNNIVFHDTANAASTVVYFDVRFEENCTNITLGTYCHNMRFGNGCRTIAIQNQALAAQGSPESSTVFGAWCDTITIETNILNRSSGPANVGAMNTWVFGNGVNSVTLQATMTTSTATAKKFYLGDNVASLTFATQHYNANGLLFKKEKGFSTFKKSADITGVTTFSFTTLFGNEIGDATLTSTGATETINSITGTTSGEIYIFRPESGLIVTFTDGTLVNAGNVNFVANGTNGDYIIYENRSGVLFQIGGVNY